MAKNDNSGKSMICSAIVAKGFLFINKGTLPAIWKGYGFVRWGAMPCRAVPCRATPCHAVPR